MSIKIIVHNEVYDLLACYFSKTNAYLIKKVNLIYFCYVVHEKLLLQ